MTDTKSLQDLVNSVNTLRQKLDIVGLCSATLMDSNRNASKLSEFHTRFDSLTRKYCEFAEEYQCELDEFHKSLLNSIRLNQLRELQKQNERERLEILKQIEVISNSNTEIDVNETNIVYTPTPSIKYDDAKQEDVDTDAKSESVVVESKPAIKKEPVTNTPKAPKNAVRKSAKPKPKPRKTAPSHKVRKTPKTQRSTESVNEDQRIMDEAYKYNAKRVRWGFHGPQKSSTVIFIGNLPSNESGVKITEKKLEFWIMQRAHVTITQIEEVKLQRGARGMHALVRFASTISLHKIRRFLDKMNSENQAAYVNEKGKGRVSWKKQVFMRLNRNFRKSGDAMWTDKAAQHRLFIRNFDILNAECHYELTHALLEFGDLYQDIEIRVDGFGDPYCIATFKYINDAIYCCNSETVFNGRMLEMRYAKY